MKETKKKCERVYENGFRIGRRHLPRSIQEREKRDTAKREKEWASCHRSTGLDQSRWSGRGIPKHKSKTNKPNPTDRQTILLRKGSRTRKVMDGRRRDRRVGRWGAGITSQLDNGNWEPEDLLFFSVNRKDLKRKNVFGINCKSCSHLIELFITSSFFRFFLEGGLGVGEENADIVFSL